MKGLKWDGDFSVSDKCTASSLFKNMDALQQLVTKKMKVRKDQPA